jgi:release factor glutamine methyltransferase
VAQALQQATAALREAGIETPRLDAEVLLAHALGVDRARLLAQLHEPLAADVQRAFAQLIARRLRHEPVAYLVGHKEFYGLDFLVDRRVLIPRPETELLVERAIALGRELLGAHRPSLTIADVGTGCGCIAVVLAVHLPRAQVFATERSPQALEVARENVGRHGVEDRVHLLCGDLLAPIPPEVHLDLIVANLPYVSWSELEALPRSIREYEPLEAALDGGEDGLVLIRRLLEGAPQRLRPGGAVLLEIGATQGPRVAEIARRRFPEAEIRVLPDLAGRDRVVEIRT